MSRKVYVGMSGGVDSSLSAYLLVEQGYDVTGVYMKNWSKSFSGMQCPWANDLADAKRVAVKLDINFKVFDFEKEYKSKVVDYMLDEYKKGNTPNPDIMCNEHIKFKLFSDLAFSEGADFVATGHYARTHNGKLLLAEDEKKDQTYFLYRIKSDVLKKTIFPLGGYLKTEVRREAKDRGIIVADKKDSVGICFVGQVGIKEFIGEYIEASVGRIIDIKSGKTLGWHDGATFYTLGQRKGLDISGGRPYYVVGKDMQENIVFVSDDIGYTTLWQDKVFFDKMHSISKDSIVSGEYYCRVRHQAPLVKAYYSSENMSLHFSSKQKSLTAGQSIVLYKNNECIGGGIIALKKDIIKDNECTRN